MTDGVHAPGGIIPQHARRIPIQPHTASPSIIPYDVHTSLSHRRAYGPQLHDICRVVAQYSESTTPNPHFGAYGQLRRNPPVPPPIHPYPSTAQPVVLNVSAQMSPPHLRMDATAPALIPPSSHSQVHSDFSCDLPCHPPSYARHSTEIMDPHRTAFDECVTVAGCAPPDSDIWASAQVSKYSELIGATEVLGGAAYGDDLANDPYQYNTPDGQGSHGASSVGDSENEFGWPNFDGVFTDAAGSEIPSTMQSGPSLPNRHERYCQTSSLAYALGGHGPVLP